MKPEELIQLLHEDEGPTLDFKRDQYPFAKATDEEKSELLKDILGFVNCWRRSEAVILIGVEEVQGGRSVVHGVAEHLPDHSLQQFVTSLTNRPVQFGYETCENDGKQVGIIRIELQRRPVFLKRDYGKLRKGEVYVRRGSSTDPSKPADPDEIAMMGTGASIANTEASLSVEFGALDQEKSLGQQIEWIAEFCKMPDSKEIPTLQERPNQIDLPGGRSIYIPSAASLDIHKRLNQHYYRKLAEYEFVRRLFRKVRLVVCNTDDIPASEVRLEIVIPTNEGVVIVDSSDIPGPPKRRVSTLEFDPKMFKGRGALHHAGEVEIDKNEYHMKVEIDCGILQPGRRVWTDEFYLGIAHTRAVELTGHLFSSNLPIPRAFTLTVKATISQAAMTVEQLVSMDEPEEETGE